MPASKTLAIVGVVHQGQRLAFGPEAGEDLAAVHAGLDELQRDCPPHRLGLLGHVDRAHAPFADRLQQLVRADDRAGTFEPWPTEAAAQMLGSLGLRDVARLRITRPVSGGLDRRADRPRRGSQESADPLVVPQQCLDLRPQLRFAPACLIQVSRTLRAALVGREPR